MYLKLFVCLDLVSVWPNKRNNFFSILWRSVLLVEETGVPGENHRPVASYWQTLSHDVVSSTLCHEQRGSAKTGFTVNEHKSWPQGGSAKTGFTIYEHKSWPQGGSAKTGFTVYEHKSWPQEGSTKTGFTEHNC